QKDHSLDFLAYSYETEGGGYRMREAINRRMINGVLVQDYINYKPVDEENVVLEELDQVYEKGGLEELSRIINEEVYVTVD
ncbi:MAG: DUF6503 family protein, partial [Bacteroidota bacterium]